MRGQLSKLPVPASIPEFQRRSLPPQIALLALPVAFVVTQLGVAIVRDGALWLLVHRVEQPGTAEAVATLLAMGTNSLLLLAVAVVVPMTVGRAVGRAERQSVGGASLAWLQPRPAPLGVFLAAALGTVALGPLADLLMASMAAWLPGWTLGSMHLLHDLAQRHSAWVLWPFLALLPGVAEEVFFRGMLQRAFVRPNVAISVSAGAFALFHLDPHHVMGVLPLGFFLSWVAQRHGLAVTVFAHVVNNTVALCSAQVPDLDVGYGTETPLPFYWVPVGLVTAAFAMRVLRTNRPAGSGPSEHPVL